MKINRKSLTLLPLLFLAVVAIAQKPKDKLTVTVRVAIDTLSSVDSAEVEVFPYETIGPVESKSIKQKLINATSKWIIPSKVPFRMFTRFLPPEKRIYFLAEPGDNLSFAYKNGKLSVAGKGAEKILLRLKLNALRDSLKFLISNKAVYKTHSLADYLEWNNYLNERLRLSLPIVNEFKSKISTVAFEDMRNMLLDGVADDRSDKFATFIGYARENGYTSADISRIYDTTYRKNMTAKVLPSMSGNFFGSWAFIRFKVYRDYGFEYDSFPLNSDKERALRYYNTATSIYYGLALEKFKADFLTDQLIHRIGFTPETESLLKNYLAEGSFPSYKQYVSQYAKKARSLKVGRPSPEFTLTKDNGTKLSKASLDGKVVLMDFWFTGCVGCLQMTPALKKVEEAFKNDTNVVFVSVSTDKNYQQWLNSIKDGKYTTGTAVNLYTGGQGADHPIIKDFQVGGYPSLYLIDAVGRIVVNPVPDPRGGRANELTNLIKSQLVLLKDGPYVIKENSSLTAYSLNGINVETKKLEHTESMINVATDQYGKSFKVKLHQPFLQASEFLPAEKLLALSDIEGNFEAFRKLLQNNHVIDESFNWTFGKGHLVFAGDMFDRGQQVTECLWLVYSLEEKANAAGGEVHFILGNHELMNLSGDIRYVKQKYIDNAKLIGKSYLELYGENTELGNWLRTKNIAEKVGPLLFTHGGISPEFIGLGLSLNKVNELARPFYANDSTARRSQDKNLATIYSTKKGPFWYRDYYLDQPVKMYSNGDTVYKTSQSTIDKTLAFYGVKHIVTGHTIIKPGEHVSVHYNNKVINTDTEHAKGKSEALLVEGKSYYRVNDKGERWLLFKDE